MAQNAGKNDRTTQQRTAADATRPTTDPVQPEQGDAMRQQAARDNTEQQAKQDERGQDGERRSRSASGEPQAGDEVTWVNDGGTTRPARITRVHEKREQGWLVDVHIDPDAPERESRGAVRYVDNDLDARELAGQGHSVVRPVDDESAE